MNIKACTFLPNDPLPPGIILPQQTHSARVVQIITGQEDLTACDGVWTRDNRLLLGIKTADCAPICLWSEHQYGVLHAGWRGLVNGAVENMLKVFTEKSVESLSQGERLGEGNISRKPLSQSLPLGGKSYELNIWVGPLHSKFQIQRDECYDLIKTKFGDQFFSNEEGEIIFNFKACLQHLLPPQTVFDERSTYHNHTLASWRRDKAFPNGQNTTVIGPTRSLQG